jgi:hypothetical protein
MVPDFAKNQPADAGRQADAKDQNFPIGLW